MNAHENPLRSDRVLTVRYRLQDANWDALLNRLTDLRYRAAILGYEGSGKTTLLEDMASHLALRGLRPTLILHNAQCPQVNWRALAQLGPRDVLLLDGADLLPLPQWWRLRWLGRRFGGMIVTSHTRAMLPVLLTCQTSPKLLSDLLGELLPGESPDHLADHMATLANDLFTRHNGNLRDALRELYDRYAGGQGDVISACRPRMPLSAAVSGCDRATSAGSAGA